MHSKKTEIVELLNELNDQRLPIQGLLKYLNHDKLVIFGAGEVAYIMYKYLTAIGIDILFSLVSQGQEKDTEKILLNIPPYATCEKSRQLKVCHETEVRELENYAILLCVGNKAADEKRIQFAAAGRDLVYDFNFSEYGQLLYQLLRRTSLKLKMEKHHIDITSEIVRIKEHKLINPFMEKGSYMDDFAAESDDLLFPLFFNDYEDIDEGTYEYENVILKKDDVVIDCGANIGLFSSYAAFHGCRVYAFEPIAETRNNLQKNADLYKGNIEIQPLALSNQSGKCNIKINSFLGGGNSMVLDVPYEETRIIETITLDDFVKINGIQKIDFIKADIEGAERLMLQGAVTTLRNMTPKLAICTYHLKDDAEVLAQIIKKANPLYKIVYKWKKLYAYV